jgi:ribosome biogenesis protein Nip4
MEIKECKSQDFILREIEILLNKIRYEFRDTYVPKNIEVRSVYWDTEKCISKVDISTPKIFGIKICEEKYYTDIVRVSFRDRELKVEIKENNKFLIELSKKYFKFFAHMNENSIKSLCFVEDF